jgi:hypothetical protein
VSRTEIVREMAKKLLYDLTQLPGKSSADENRLGRALVRFLDRPHLSVDALLDTTGTTPGSEEGK